jgi:tryptophan synthase beta subunit
MSELKFIEARKENNCLNQFLLPTTMSKNEMMQLRGGEGNGGTETCEAGCGTSNWTTCKPNLCPTQTTAVKG